MAVTIAGRTIKINIDKQKHGIFAARELRPIKGEFRREFVGVTPRGLPFGAIARHEFGHVLYWHVEKTTGRVRFQRFKEALNESYLKARLSGDIHQISRYALDRPTEFFAECFSMHEAREPLPMVAAKMLDAFFKIGGMK
jgi:hypothetical protein